MFVYRKRRGGEFTQLWLHLHPGTKCHGGNKSYRERSSTSAWMWILSSLSCSSSHFKREWFLTLFKCGSFVCRHVLEEEVVTVSELKRALFFFFFFNLCGFCLACRASRSGSENAKQQRSKPPAEPFWKGALSSMYTLMWVTGYALRREPRHRNKVPL